MSTWLITGANRGIGFELTKQAAAAGHSIIATARHPADAKELAALAAGSGGKIEVLPLEVTDDASIQALKSALKGRAIDVLVNNAGVRAPERPAFHTDFETFARVLAINTLSPVRVTEALVDNLAASKDAKVLTISSGLGSFAMGSVEEMAYCVSKTAVNRAMNLLAKPMQAKTIAVGLLTPGWVRTDMGGSAAPLSVEESAAGLLKTIGAFSMKDAGQAFNYKGERQAAW